MMEYVQALAPFLQWMYTQIRVYTQTVHQVRDSNATDISPAVIW
jgi:hypothetical protein